MREIRFRAWHIPEKRMYARGYQQWNGIILCEMDPNDPEGKGRAIGSASYSDCVLLECTDIADSRGTLIFEGDILEIRVQNKIILGEVPSVPDMFRSRRIHPLHDLLVKYGLSERDLANSEVKGNIYENSAMLLDGN